MKQFTLSLNKNFQRPVVYLEKFFNLYAVLDIFPNMHIIAARLNMPFQMILSATMFRNLIYEIDTYNHKLNVTIPDTQSNVRNLVIYDKDGIMHVACSDGKLANCT